MNTLLKYTLILAAISLALTFNGYAQSAPQSSNASVLSGHAKRNEDALKMSSDVVVAAFTALGYPGSDADGENDYDQAQIEVVTALKGTLSGKLKVFYIVQSFPGKDQESPPALGTQYIMFIRKMGPTEYEIKKLLPATDENITKVKALIAAASAGK